MLVTLYWLSVFALGSEAEPQLQNAASSWPPTISLQPQTILSTGGGTHAFKGVNTSSLGPATIRLCRPPRRISQRRDRHTRRLVQMGPRTGGLAIGRRLGGAQPASSRPADQAETPPAAPCHRELGGAGGGNCQSVRDGFGDSAWHARNPISNMWQNYNNYSCMPSRGACTTVGYPVYVVTASSAGDVERRRRLRGVRTSG